MARITPGNRLYLYQLLSREIGTGKQTMLSRVEEVLVADDILPSDLECADVRELLTALDDFVRLTVFKKGRVYATVLAQPEWDELIARANDESTEKSAPAKGGPRSWKRKRAAKAPKPAKPRPKGRPKPEAVVPAKQESEAEAETMAPAEPTAEVTPAEPTTKAMAAEPTAEVAAMAEHVATPKPAAEVVEMPDSAVEPKLDSAPEAQPAEPGPEVMAPSAPEVAPEPTPAFEEAPNPKTEPEAAPTEGPTQTPEHTPSITFTITYDPTKEDVAPDEPDAATNPTLDVSPVSEEVASLEEGTGDEEVASLDEGIGAEEDPEPQETPQPRPAPKPETRTIRLQPQAILPHHFATEVVCKNTMLSALYQILPFDVDPIALLDEDWLIARSTETYTLDGGLVTFPLRYLRERNGSPLTLCMRRKPRTASGKRWELVGFGGTNVALDHIGFDGLPLEDAGAWSDLVAGASLSLDFVTPARVMALFAHLGPWDQLLSALSDLAAPEAWGPANETLKEYLTLTFYRVMQQDLLVTAPDLSWAAFDTGLLTKDAASIYMRFCAGDKSNPWEFLSFSTEVPQPVPQPASYITTLDDITFAPPYTVRTSSILARTYGDKLQPAMDRALKQARRNYRVATPAYDPRADRLRLLLPICLEDETDEASERKASGALVLARQPQGGYLATSVLSLDRARTCARVVSADPPAWLL